ncbi:MAG: cyclic nucleotide-binding domain-containing protein [Acidobacteriota bacterium]|nr:cyclic nucleotide-binding domain-containing protein [Acidobacteriota bacterium]
MDIETRLRRWETFSHFSDEQLSQLARCASLHRFPAGVTIFKAGDSSRDAYLVDTGRLRIQRQTPYGLYTLAELGEGEIFGESSYLDGEVRSGDAFVIAETELLSFNPVALEALAGLDQRITVALYWSFWKSLATKLRTTNEKLTQFFSEAGKPPSSPSLEPKGTPADFRIDLAAKRKLFQEQKLSNLEINFLSTLSKEQQVAPGEVIFHEGDVGDKMYIVLDGRVMISKYIPGAGEEALAFLERGDYFGEMALIDNQPRSADAKAPEEGAVLLAIPRDVVEGLLDIHKVSSLRLLRILSNLIAKRLRELNEKLITWFIFSGGGGQG